MTTMRITMLPAIVFLFFMASQLPSTEAECRPPSCFPSTTPPEADPTIVPLDMYGRAIQSFYGQPVSGYGHNIGRLGWPNRNNHNFPGLSWRYGQNPGSQSLMHHLQGLNLPYGDNPLSQSLFHQLQGFNLPYGNNRWSQSLMHQLQGFNWPYGNDHGSQSYNLHGLNLPYGNNNLFPSYGHNLHGFNWPHGNTNIFQNYGYSQGNLLNLLRHHTN